MGNRASSEWHASLQQRLTPFAFRTFCAKRRHRNRRPSALHFLREIRTEKVSLHPTDPARHRDYNKGMVLRKGGKVLRIIKFILHGPLCGRWYATPIFVDGSKGGVSGFDSFASMESFTSKYQGAAIVYIGAVAARRRRVTQNRARRASIIDACSTETLRS